MAVDYGDLDQYFDGGATFSIGGKKYRIPPVSASLGLWGRSVFAKRGALSDDLTPEEMETIRAQIETEIGPPPIPEGQTELEAFLSPKLVAELIADGVSDPALQHLAQVTFIRVIAGDELAKAAFQGEIGPKAAPANRQERRAAKKAAPKKAASSSRTTNTAAGSTTRKAASGSTTKSQPKPAKAAKASPGRKS